MYDARLPDDMTSDGHWIHDLDPIAIRFGPDFGIRWYGLAYATAFLLTSFMLGWLHRRGRSPLGPAEQSTLLMAIMIGVLAGGRIGFMLLYDFPVLLSDPLSALAIWRGGMSSHGGFVGVACAVLWAARRFRVPPLTIGDLLCVMAPQGLMLGRLANFVNGELWGKPSGAPWAVIFPQSAPPGTPPEWIEPRHPSQLYEAALEGLMLLVWTQWRLWRTDAWKSPGRITAEFLVLYAAARIAGEQFREPDAGLILGMSRGVFYSLFILAAGIAMLVASRRSREGAAHDGRQRH